MFALLIFSFSLHNPAPPLPLRLLKSSRHHTFFLWLMNQTCNSTETLDDSDSDSDNGDFTQILLWWLTSHTTLFQWLTNTTTTDLQALCIPRCIPRCRLQSSIIPMPDYFLFQWGFPQNCSKMILPLSVFCWPSLPGRQVWSARVCISPLHNHIPSKCIWGSYKS